MIQEIFEEIETGVGEDGFGMELHAFDFAALRGAGP